MALIEVHPEDPKWMRDTASRMGYDEQKLRDLLVQLQDVQQPGAHNEPQPEDRHARLRAYLKAKGLEVSEKPLTEEEKQRIREQVNSLSGWFEIYNSETDDPDAIIEKGRDIE